MRTSHAFGDVRVRYVGRLPEWARELLTILGLVVRVTVVFAVAVVLGVLVAIKLGDGNPWLAAAVAAGFLLFVVLPVRLWRARRRQ
jgi:membrane protein DedA with SNARE-associated domain